MSKIPYWQTLKDEYSTNGERSRSFVLAVARIVEVGIKRGMIDAETWALVEGDTWRAQNKDFAQLNDDNLWIEIIGLIGRLFKPHAGIEP